MTDTPDTTPGREMPPSQWETLVAAHAQRQAELFELNKVVLFDALAAAGITEIVVTFDGFGDSGQVEDTEVKNGDNYVDLPATTIEIAEAIWGEPEPRRSSIDIAAAVENLVYDVLGMTHAGWQDGAGAYGEVTFEVAVRTITLDHNTRYTAIESYLHTF